jgi:hypothetical protein
VKAPPRVAEPASAPTEGSGPALASSESLAEQYTRIAHADEGRPIDVVLRSLDLAIAGLALVALSPIVALVSLTSS